MRKSAIVLGFGAFFLTLALLLKFYAYPQLAVVPLDQNSRQVVIGEDATFFSADDLEVKQGDLRTVVTVIGDPEASKAAQEETGRDVVVWNKGQTTDNNGEPPPMSAYTSQIVFDRHTGMAVNCCGESINGEPVEHEGLLVKFPFQTEKKTYPYFDTTLREAFPAKFKGVEEINGLTVYRFEQDVPRTKYAEIEVPPSVFGLPEGDAVVADRYYENHRTIWVEPETGVMIKVQEEQYQTLEVPNAEPVVAVETTSVFSEETVQKNVDAYEDKATQLRILRTVAPMVLGVLGVLLLLVGIAMAVTRGRRSDGEDDEVAVSPWDDDDNGSTATDALPTRAELRQRRE